MGILFTIAYDGTDYCGWQIQKNGVSVCSVLEAALHPVFSDGFSLLGASRTDAGVHALGQRAHLIPKSFCKVPLDKLPLVINSCLPKDIRIVDATSVPDSFHPINDAKSKTYRYQIHNHKYENPLLRRYAAFVPAHLDITAMHNAAGHFAGCHDFAAFCASGSSVKSTVRTVFSVDVERCENSVFITISGDGFLYNMVRIIAGTLVDIGHRKLSAGDLPAVILSKDRAAAGKTMPPQGLTLMEVFYDNC